MKGIDYEEVLALLNRRDFELAFLEDIALKEHATELAIQSLQEQIERAETDRQWEEMAMLRFEQEMLRLKR